MANDVDEMFEALRSSVNRGVNNISVKATSSLEKGKRMAQIENIEADVRRLISVAGEMAYTAWESGEKDFSRLEDTLVSIRQKREEIARLNSEMAAIDAQDQQLTGSVRAPGTTPPPVGVTVCPTCGLACSSAAVFCQKCGTRLQ